MKIVNMRTVQRMGPTFGGRQIMINISEQTTHYAIYKSFLQGLWDIVKRTITVDKLSLIFQIQLLFNITNTTL